MKKQILDPERLRQVPDQFSWVDQHLVRGGHLRACDPPAWALYLFLTTVADAQGLSYYSDASLCRWIRLDQAGLDTARRQLIQAGLLAYQKPLSQLLALAPANTPPDTAAAAARTGQVRSVGELLRQITGGAA
jgi:hypothetical protein